MDWKNQWNYILLEMGSLDNHKLPKNEWMKKNKKTVALTTTHTLPGMIAFNRFSFWKTPIYQYVFFYSTSRLDFQRSSEGNVFYFRNLMRHILKTKQHKFGALQRFETRIMKKILKFFIFSQFFFLKNSILGWLNLPFTR